MFWQLLCLWWQAELLVSQMTMWHVLTTALSVVRGKIVGQMMVWHVLTTALWWQAEDAVKEERVAVMRGDDPSSPTGQQLKVLSTGSRTAPVEKDVTHPAQPPHHLQQAPYLQFEGQKDQQVPWFSFSLDVVHASLTVTPPLCSGTP